ncbi:MAG: ferredoxin--NADP reductase [Pseudomonadota bacterium]
MPANFNKETVIDVHHWTDRLFSFKTTRDPAFRFESGHFTMVGLEIEGRPLTRAYSLASANYEETLEFFSIKVPDGPLTSRLKDVQVGDEVLVSRKPTGTLTLDQVLPGRNLYLLGTGTGLAPYLSLIQDPEIYERFEKIVLVHGVRHVKDLAYREFISQELPNNEFFGEMVRKQLVYYPTVTREDFVNRGRITTALESGRLAEAAQLPPLSVEDDRFMICGSPDVLKDIGSALDELGFSVTRSSTLGEYAIERSFVEH